MLGAGVEVATVSLADKAAKLRARDTRPAARKLNHYRATLDEVVTHYGASDLSDELRAQLARSP